MWLCRQIPKHKITDMSKQRNQANKQKETNTKEILLSAVGCTHSGDEAPLVITNKSKKKRKQMKKFNFLRLVNDLSNINIREMAPVATHHFPLHFSLLVTHLLTNQTNACCN
jgi:aspartyl-tRNA synthetase